MRITLDDLEKLELSSITASAESQFHPDDVLTAILKVKKRNYVPKNVKLRARLDDQMFTGEFTAGDLKEIDSDKNVESVSISKRLRRIA